MKDLARELALARERYDVLGFDTFPLTPGMKKPPLIAGWNRDDLRGVWNDVCDIANIAIRCGGLRNLAVIDCDDKNTPGTTQNILDYLEGLGLPYSSLTVVQTASKIGRHIYIEIEDPPFGSKNSLNHLYGSGDLRYGPGAYVVAPPSQIIGGNPYVLLQGNFVDIPTISWSDIAPITTDLIQTPQRTKNHISQFAKKMLIGDINLLHNYPSRSEAEYALMISLINTGNSYSDILQLFEKCPCAGKYKEKGGYSTTQGRNYFNITYWKAKEWSENHISAGRKIAEDAIVWAQSRPWPGRTGSTDRSIFIAHARIAQGCGKTVYSASCRELAIIANVSYETAAKATKRLVSCGLLVIEEESIALFSTKYSIGNNLTLPQYQDVRGCQVISEHDAFARRGFGKSGREICEQLQNKPKTINELVETTGRCRRTIHDKLDRMSRIIDPNTGEILSLVRKEGEAWFLNPNANLDLIAQILHLDGKMRDREYKYQKQSRAHSNFFKNRI